MQQYKRETCVFILKSYLSAKLLLWDIKNVETILRVSFRITGNVQPRHFIEGYKAKYTMGGHTVLNKHIPYVHIHSQSLIVSLWLDHDTEDAYV
jgi:hypothetical protein